ncbi:hypothetical protein BXY85_0335 [Roseivirga pacifica]|uniref:Uncharacterized protein n=1 Tax=Roseivirga pacifica TaxID=1267423 RepID=A0A1I0RBG3_9BACT|nr:hypothetical protein [Roseivirga pacifica]RKQ49346.1 hypothetical protein BXY85_0335 [Roseivirga pacifica]SEW38172.1 hypothetical protein SAMN05216290_3388 [Roseivirga pacifica]
MGVTRLKRKARRNKQTSAKRTARIKTLTAKPVLKNVDAEELKASFTTEEPKKAKKAAAKKEEAPKVEATTEATEEPKAEKPKKKVAKKEETKEEE